MKGKGIFVLSGLVLLLTLTMRLGFAEESMQPAATSAVEIKSQEPQDVIGGTTTELETQWVWGEITSLDPQNKEITINYFDYETDAEKELKLSLGDNTKYENINSLSDLKLHDTISVDYVLGTDGKYTVRNISVEKPEESPIPSAKAADEKPVAAPEAQPAG